MKEIGPGLVRCHKLYNIKELSKRERVIKSDFKKIFPFKTT
jgi:hypothetical protein